MFGVVICGAIFDTIGDLMFGTNAKPHAEHDEQPTSPAPTKCLSCGAEKDERGNLPCGH
ncbi:hypothetical protein [Paraburkholderia silvatlantica]|uniref:Uncharacterized protein n=1 Tax=Paraburkholderia silvatlantica TaxID=321895 RepID=A0ABR6FMM2_9BURK|nr:hypothetical protein [Paraburkholderia silvatlantica]MBB2928367.1 hypothetical protein [Paraburkholderia silvatlantica]PVY34588.1 hypothetical protein C7411_107124 [Paraburkholderia silvatlantica]PXW38803.1 hypothetical protein C7413_107124 [Paraburkholderia silvatlantica]